MVWQYFTFISELCFPYDFFLDISTSSYWNGEFNFRHIKYSTNFKREDRLLMSHARSLTVSQHIHPVFWTVLLLGSHWRHGYSYFLRLVPHAFT